TKVIASAAAPPVTAQAAGIGRSAAPPTPWARTRSASPAPPPARGRRPWITSANLDDRDREAGVVLLDLHGAGVLEREDVGRLAGAERHVGLRPRVDVELALAVGGDLQRQAAADRHRQLRGVRADRGSLDH